MELSNIIVADMKQKDKCYTETVYQYNYGMVLQIINYDLPETYEVHFSNTKTGVAKSQLGSVAGVRIPGEYFIPGQYIYAWIFTHPTEGSGVTVAEITIPISDRARYTDEIPTPEQESIIGETINTLNEAVDEVHSIADAMPDTIADALAEAKASGEFDGPKGDKGDTGEGVAPGGTLGQVLKKTGSEDFETGWADETVRDVQIAGASILSNGVANVPVAGANSPGVVKVSQGLGIELVSDTLKIVAPSTNDIKNGSATARAIVPARQHESAFYGLAKAAGDTTQPQSNNAVGRYTDAAKAAIQTMLDIPSNAGMRAAIAAVNTMDIHICTSEEYDAETGMPTIQNPDEKTFYLVPGGEGNNMFIEWAYVDNAWERFGSADVKLEVATIEETQAIITDYDSREEDEGMVFEMVFIDPEQGDPHYESVDGAETILAAFKAGKNTVLHFEKNATYSCGESYATITGYNCHDSEYTIPEKIFVDPDIDNVGQYIMINSTRVENDKLYVPIYID